MLVDGPTIAALTINSCCQPKVGGLAALEEVAWMRSGALIDAHVHYYSAYDTQRFLDAASEGFERQAEDLAVRILCMAESASDNWFGSLLEPDALAHTNWQRFSTEEPQSLRLRRESDNAELLVIAGHQCVTAEDIEVLMLGQTAKHPDGQPAETVVQAALDAGAIPLLPWGFGKWIGARGQLVGRLLETFGRELLLGDNSGRLNGTPTPSLLQEGSERGHCLLPGSDPLPMRGEEHKVASFGAFIEGEVGIETPFADLKVLLASGIAPETFGGGESLLRFVRNQLLMQKRKRWPSRG